MLSSSQLSSPRSVATLQHVNILYICKDSWVGEPVGVVELCLSGLTGKFVTEHRLCVRGVLLYLSSLLNAEIIWHNNNVGNGADNTTQCNISEDLRTYNFKNTTVMSSITKCEQFLILNYSLNLLGLRLLV